jgi:MFS family permease
MIAIIGTLTMEFQTIWPLFAKFSLGGNAGTLAALTSVMSLGSVLGGLWVASRQREVEPKTVIGAAFFIGVGVLLTSLVRSWIFILIAVFLTGIGFIMYTTYSQIILQLKSEPHMRGRVMALWSVFLLGTTPIGAPIIGYLSQHTTPRWGLAVGGVAAILASFYGWLKLVNAKTKEINTSYL